MKHTISGLVKNRAGILAQVVGLFKKFDVNIKSVAVSETESIETSRLTIVVEGHDKEVREVTAGIKKLRDVVEIDDLARKEFLDREMALVKVQFEPDVINHLTQIAEVFGAQVIAMGKETITFEMSGDEDRVDGFINAVMSFGIRALARSGRVALRQADEV
ncbi:MAG TPA: acetolactate synthase small subunit [Thermoguttaceae bacterium]|nr:acetolactate synthase small subunit [Thermoguttaceae bacterium]